MKKSFDLWIADTDRGQFRTYATGKRAAINKIQKHKIRVLSIRKGGVSDFAENIANEQAR